MGSILGDIFEGQAGKDAAAANTARLQQLQTTGNGVLDSGLTSSNGALDQAGAAYQPLSALASKYGAGSKMYLDALGVNGADAANAARSSFTASPGYQWDVSQALDQTNRAAAPSTGGALAGNTLAALSDRAGNMANNEWSSWLDRLAGTISPELSATSGAASGQAGVATNRANLYQSDAGRRLGLAQGVTSGINDQTTQSANAETAGAGNVLKAGMGLATLAAGAAGGAGLGSLGSLASTGGSLLGGTSGEFGPTTGNASYLSGGKWSFG